MRLRSTIGTIAALSITLLLLTVPTLNQALDDAIPSGNSPSVPSSTAEPGQHGRAFPRLSLGGGRQLEYAGVFSSDAKFRAPSKFARFLEAIGAEPIPARPTWQREVPPEMLHTDQRLVEHFVPPAHATALPDAHTSLGNARDAVVRFAYGRPSLLQAPQHVTTDSRQRAIVSDPALPAVHVLDPKGKTSFSILGGQNHLLQVASGVAVDREDNIYVADAQQGMVLVYDQYGRFLRYIGNIHGENMYQRPTGIAIDRKAGHLYLADTPRHIVLMLDLEGNVLKAVGKQWGETGTGELKRRQDTGPREFKGPTEIAVDDHKVVVLDSGGTRVQIMDLECNLLGDFTVLNVPYHEVDRGNGLGIDQDGNIYVSYVGTSEIRVYNPKGALLATFGQAGPRAGEFSAPQGLWIDSRNRMYVADTANVRVQLFQLSLH
jgi:DNA-binding beta-propeller fold protein YncE